MKKSILICLCVGSVLCATTVESKENYHNAQRIFDDRIAYDIYFSSSDYQTTVAHSVEIIRFEEIGNKTFLVIRSAGFSLKDEEGFILFDSVLAILHDRNFKVQHHTGIKYRQR